LQGITTNGNRVFTRIAGSRFRIPEEVDPFPVTLLGKIRESRAAPVLTPEAPLPPTALRNDRLDFEAYSAEVQKLFQRGRHTAILGGRYQNGDFDRLSALDDSSVTQLSDGTTVFPSGYNSMGVTNEFSLDFERLEAYGYLTWQVAESLWLMTGLVYQHLLFPSNVRAPPISDR
jgi:hypothetical protein